MKTFKSTALFGAGLIIQGATRIIDRFVDIPNALHHTLMLSALALMLWGIVVLARSPKMQNSRIRQWKLRLIGRGME